MKISLEVPVRDAERRLNASYVDYGIWMLTFSRNLMQLRIYIKIRTLFSDVYPIDRRINQILVSQDVSRDSNSTNKTVLKSFMFRTGDG